MSRLSGVASPKIWGGPKNFGGTKVYDFRRITLFCLEKRPSKHKIFSKHFGGPWPLWPPTGYAYEQTAAHRFFSYVTVCMRRSGW